MSTNPISQTLFRFVSMRNPELADENGKTRRFIFRPAGIKGHFDKAVESKPAAQSAWQAIKTAAASFTDVYKDIKDIQALSQNLYTFSVWLARNRSTCSAEELQERAASLSPVTTAQATILWDNLFYQVVTQKDFYQKEAIMQLIMASHVVIYLQGITENQSAEKRAAAVTWNQELLKAKVVLPKQLFGETASTPGTAGFSRMAAVAKEEELQEEPSATLIKKQAAAVSRLELESFQTLKDELVKAEKAYRKEYQVSYDKAMESYQQEIQPILDDHAQKVEDKRQQWCSIRKPDVPYDANDPCNQPPVVPMPDLPKFRFEFRPELEENFLQSRLSAKSLFTLQALLDTDDPESGAAMRMEGIEQLEEARLIAPSGIPLGDLENFQELHQVIEGRTAQTYQVLLDNTDTGGNTSISVGGVIIPVLDTPLPDPEPGVAGYSFTVKTLPVSKTQWNLLFTLDNGAGSIVRASYKAVKSGNELLAESTFVQQTTPGTFKLFGGSSPLPINSNTINGFLFNGSLRLSDGKDYAFSITMFYDTSNGVEPLTRTYPLQGSGRLRVIIKELDPIDPSEPGPVLPAGNGTSSFVPSGFGFKQLGIADYKKVEQSVHCYVEGEVAHIENIMAREYKEKATRKLRRSEVTTTTTTEQEKEQLSDTTTADRFEMQSEVDKVLQQSKDFSANANVKYEPTSKLTLSAGATFATHSSKEENIRQAVKQAREVTERAMERVVNKIREERIEKIIEEFEENNRHGFDNKNGDQHVVGVYRWVDKVYKNQIYNYGKRLMFEFMVPQPAKLHLAGMLEEKDKPSTNVVQLVKPVDPRTIGLEDASKITEDNYKAWTARYEAAAEKPPARYLFAGKSVVMGGSAEQSIDVPEGYGLIMAKVNTLHRGGGSDGNAAFSIGDVKYWTNQIDGGGTYYFDSKVYDKKVSIAVYFRKAETGLVNFDLKFERSQLVLDEWKLKTYQAIMEAYQDALEKYNDNYQEEVDKGEKLKESNPGFYRQIENTILRKNCMSYLINQDPAAALTFGKDKYYINDGSAKATFSNLDIKVDASLDSYSAFVKFMEQAFEWEIMSYYFYPYYWGKRADWMALYQQENNDPIFRAFMQSGMARVIVTVRPGFEDAVRHYMATGQIWNGGEVPVLDDPLYLSIVDELRAPEGLPEGKAWPTRIPTSLTILQADSIGLKVEKALPCNCDDLSDFEDPEKVPCGDGFEKYEDVQLNGATAKAGTARIVGAITGADARSAKVLLKKVSGEIADLTYPDTDGRWELNQVAAGKYELLLDADNIFDTETYVVVTGSKNNVAILEDNDVKEFTLTVEKR